MYVRAKPGSLPVSRDLEHDLAAAPFMKQAFAWSKPALSAQGVVSDREGLGEGAGLNRRKRFGHRHGGAFVGDGQLGLSATSDEAITRSPRPKRAAPGPNATTSPASSRPKTSGGEPGGAG